jgi:hypothetical protein
MKEKIKGKLPFKKTGTKIIKEKINKLKTINKKVVLSC